MTALIVALLAAVGIGGGVMIASNSGGGGGGGAAIVENVNPGGSGGSSIGGGTGGAVNPNLPAASPFIVNALANPSGVGIKTNGTLANNNLTIGMIAFAPISLGEYLMQVNNWYQVPAGLDNGNEMIIYGLEKTWAGNVNSNYYEGYSGGFGKKVNVYATFDLSNISDASNPLADYYYGPSQTQEFYSPKKLGVNAYPNTASNVQATWNFTPTLALGGRKMGLQHSDFGYYKWWAGLSNTINLSGYTKSSLANQNGGQQFYMYEQSRAFTAIDRSTRYAASNHIASFSGNVIGLQKLEHYNCGKENNIAEVTGNISLNVDFNQTYHTGVISGSITNMHVGNKLWYDLTIGGAIKVNSAADEFIKIYTVTYDPAQTPSVGVNTLNGENVRYLTESNMFGNGAIIKGDTVDEDEVVGGLSFVGKHTTDYFVFTYLGFGAKKD